MTVTTLGDGTDALLVDDAESRYNFFDGYEDPKYGSIDGKESTLLATTSRLSRIPTTTTLVVNESEEHSRQV